MESVNGCFCLLLFKKSLAYVAENTNGIKPIKFTKALQETISS